jgi:hypothetical protein
MGIPNVKTTNKPEFISYGGDYEHLIEDAGFSNRRLSPCFTPDQEKDWTPRWLLRR